MSGPFGYTQAKALVFSRHGEPSAALRLHMHSVSPALPDGAALVRTLAAPINPADVNTIQGSYGAPARLTTLLGTPEPSAVPGSEGCLEVLAVGPGVSELRRGDWVVPAAAGFGTFRTHALVERADQALWPIRRPAPAEEEKETGKTAGGDQQYHHDGLTPVQVATASVNPCSAWRMLRDYVDLVGQSVASFRNSAAAGTEPPRGGAWFIQNGANSGVGRAAIQLGRLWGLRSINVIRERGSAAETAALAAELTALGADVVVTEAEFLNWRAFSARLEGGGEEGDGGGGGGGGGGITRAGREPLLLGLNCVGGKSAAAMARALGEGGCMVTYGNMSRQSFPYPTGRAIFGGLRLEGFWLAAWSRANAAEKRRTVEAVVELMRGGKLKVPPVSEVRWDWATGEDVLKAAVQGTLDGFKSGKGVFVFGDT